MREATTGDVIRLLRRIGVMLELLGEDYFRVAAYGRAADNIEEQGLDVVVLWREGNLREIPGVGEALERKLDELLRTGRLEYYEKLAAQVPSGVVDFLTIPGIGPKTARTLWMEGGLTDISQLRAAAAAGQLRDLPGLGARSEARILDAIKSMKG